MINKKLYDSILNSANKINSSNRNRYGNFIIVNSQTAELLNKTINEQENKIILEKRLKKIEKIKNRIDENRTNNRW